MKNSFREDCRKLCKEICKEHAKEYAKEYVVKEKIVSVKNLMQNMKWSVDQALNALGIQSDERKLIMEQLQK